MAPLTSYARKFLGPKVWVVYFLMLAEKNQEKFGLICLENRDSELNTLNGINRSDGRAGLSHLPRFEAHPERAGSSLLGGHKAAIDSRVEPGVVAGRQIRDHCCKRHLLLLPGPVN